MSNLPERSTHYVYGAEPTVTSQAPNGWTCPYLGVPKSCVHTGLLPFWTTPMPILRNWQFRMLARCPGLFIQAFMTSVALRCPAAMFSPTKDHRYPSASIRWENVTPVGVVCE